MIDRQQMLQELYCHIGPCPPQPAGHDRGKRWRARNGERTYAGRVRSKLREKLWIGASFRRRVRSHGIGTGLLPSFTAREAIAPHLERINQWSRRRRSTGRACRSASFRPRSLVAGRLRLLLTLEVDAVIRRELVRCAASGAVVRMAPRAGNPRSIGGFLGCRWCGRLCGVSRRRRIVRRRRRDCSDVTRLGSGDAGVAARDSLATTLLCRSG